MTQMTKKSPSYDQSQIKLLCDNICEKIESLLNLFHLDYKNNNQNMISMCCPIHEGDNPSAINIYYSGDNYRGNWKCRTHNCEKIFKGSIIGFIRGVLSKQKYGWEKQGDKTCSFAEALAFSLDFTGLQEDQIVGMSSSEREKQCFSQIVLKIKQNKEEEKIGISREQTKKALQIPSEYYIQRGYSNEILIKYDIGLCDKQNKEMFNRSVSPVYDDTGTRMIGCTGRSIFEKCNECSFFHDPKEQCPEENEQWKYCKWKHNLGFKSQNHLYNMWEARDYIKESSIAIIVESPGNVWRLEEEEIHNSVAIFGSSLSDRQKIILDSSGAMKLVILTDNDEAGDKASDIIREKCHRTYQIYRPKISKNDIAEMNKEEIKTEIINYIERIK